MSLEIIGIENLPNVYIERITEESKVIQRIPLRVQRTFKVLVKIYDHRDKHSWRNTLPGLKVKCSFITDDRIDKLNKGEISLYDIPTGAAHRTVVDSCDNFATHKVEGDMISYTRVFNISMLESPNNLNVYVACFIDGLDFGSDQLNKFYGPMTREKILVGGQLNKESGYFYYPETNEEYGGPVHRFGAEYMEGSEHSTKDHKTLRFVPEENFKIIKESDLNLPTGVSDQVFATYGSQSSQGNLLGGNREMTPGGPRTNIPDPAVDVVDPNIPNNPLTEIY